MGPARQVSQATFDAVVREAMTDFALTPDEALAEARAQLSAAGVTDFSNIATSLSEQDLANHAVVRLLDALHTAAAEAEAAAVVGVDHHPTTSPHPQLRNALTALQIEASRAPEIRGVAIARGALQDTLVALPLLPVEAAKLLHALCSHCEINRTTFVALPGAMHALANALVAVAPVPTSLLLTTTSTNPHHPQTCPPPDTTTTTTTTQGDNPQHPSHHTIADATAVLRAVTVILERSETAKRAFASHATALNTVLRLLHLGDSRLCCTGNRWAKTVNQDDHTPVTRDHVDDDRRTAEGLVRASCAVCRALLSANDDAAVVSETFNRARVLCGSTSVADSGLAPLAPDVETLPAILARIVSNYAKFLDIDQGSSNHEIHVLTHETVAVLVDCLALARICAVSDEICERLVELDFPSTVFELLACVDPTQVDISLARVSVALLRSIGAHDKVKSCLCARMSVVSAVVSAHADDAQLCERYCGLVAALCLRRPDLSQKLGEEHGAVEAVLSAMSMHSEASGVQRAGCSALRNLVIRTDSLKKSVREDGRAEKLVRTAMARFPADCDDCGYSMLCYLDVLDAKEMRRDMRYTTPF